MSTVGAAAPPGTWLLSFHGVRHLAVNAAAPLGTGLLSFHRVHHLAVDAASPPGTWLSSFRWVHHHTVGLAALQCRPLRSFRFSTWTSQAGTANWYVRPWWNGKYPLRSSAPGSGEGICLKSGSQEKYSAATFKRKGRRLSEVRQVDTVREVPRPQR